MILMTPIATVLAEGKRVSGGEKKGFSPKKNSKSPIEMAKASISPRSRDTVVKSPKSPKFFSSSRSPVSERNKEWLRGLSPPVRDLSKTLSDVTCSESTTAYNHTSASTIDNKTGDMLQNSESCDSLTADNGKSDVNVTSPRRSSRRIKPREMDSSMTDVRGDDSSDVSLQSLPCNSKISTSFSGSILNSAQNSEEKNEKVNDSPSYGSDIVDGSPSSRVRRRGRRSADQSELLAAQPHANSDENCLLTPEKEIPASLKEMTPKSEASVEKQSDGIIDFEKGNSVPVEVKKSGRGRKPRGVVTATATVVAKGKGKGRGKKRKRKYTPLPKGLKKKGFVDKETDVLPEETKQCQPVPENAYDENNTPCEKDTSLEVNSYGEEKNPSQKAVVSAPPPTVNDVMNQEVSPQRGRPKKVAAVTTMDNISLVTEAPISEIVSKTSDTLESAGGGTSTVIAQIEETESRGRRLRGRRGSAKQDGKSDSECTKSKIQELSVNEVIKGSKYESHDSECSDQKDKSLTQDAVVEIKDGVAKVEDSKSIIQNVSPETQNTVSVTLDKTSKTHKVMSGPQAVGLENQEDTFGSQFKAFIESDKTLETKDLTSETADKTRIQDAPGNQDTLSGTKDGTSGSKASFHGVDVNFGVQVTPEAPKVELKTQETEVNQHVQSENIAGSKVEVEVEKPTELCTKSEDNEVKSLSQDLAPMNCDVKLNSQEPLQSSSNYSLPAGNTICETGKDSPHNIPTDILLDVPETSANMPLAPPDAMEVPQGTDMDVDAETVENIAKFLEETASSIPGATEETYSDKRPKRSSRPPRKMDDSEMNDLLMLLNMEDEESEDEDYVPKDLENIDSTAESDEGVDSDGNDVDDDDSGDDYDNESRGGSTLSNLFEMASDIAGDNDKVPTTLKHGKGGAARPKGLKNGKGGKKYKGDASNTKKGKVKGKVKYNNKGKNDDDVKKRGDEGRRKGEVVERKGPYIRVEPRRSAEVIVNTPYREEDEQDRQVRKVNINFYCKIEAKQKTAKVGYNSTLHNNYDAFSKDTTWFCSFCKNFSHTWKLGDLFGPYFIEGLTVRKKKCPKLIEGQVVESTSPNEIGRFKKRPPRRESTSDVPGEPRKLEHGGSSPPWRFVPAATPARMLCRPGSKEGGPQQTPDHPNPVSTSNTKEGSNGDPLTPVIIPAEVRPPGTECWVHEMCLLWSPGVHVSNSRLCGLEEAVIHAQDSICNNCSEGGATVGCLEKGCSLLVHVPCATQLHWTLDHLTFRSLCPKHSTLT